MEEEIKNLVELANKVTMRPIEACMKIFNKLLLFQVFPSVGLLHILRVAFQGKQPKRSHCFPPMKRDQRRIVHELAEVYGLESISYDSEPKRNVVITAVRFVKILLRILKTQFLFRADCIRFFFFTFLVT